MYYSININQIAIATHNKNFATNLDLIDGAIIVYLAQQSISLFAKKNFVVYENEVYYRICYDNIISQLPLINIENKEVIGRRIKKLEKAGVIKFYLDKKNNNKTYFTTTELFENFVSKVPTEKSIPTDSKVDTQPTQKSFHIYDNNTNDNNITYTKEKINKKEIPTISTLETVAPVVKESLTVQSVISGKCKKRTDFSGQNGVKTGTEYTPEFETFWQRYKDLCEKNIEIKKNTANAGSKQDAFLEWNKVLKRISPDKILAMIDVYAKYNLEEFAPPKHACRWLSKTIDWKDYENQIAFFQKQLPVLKQAKQPKTEAQKFLINTENRKAVVDTEAVKKQEELLIEYAKVKTEKPEFMEYFKSVLKNYFGGVLASTVDNLKMKSINTNEVVFMLPNKVYVDIMQRNKQKFEGTLKREIEGFFKKEFTGCIKFVCWNN